jgi:hypothetical protein
MEKFIEIDGVKYPRSLLDQEAESLLAMYLQTTDKLRELKSVKEAFQAAENEMVDALRAEFVTLSSGISFADLFD